MMDAWILDTVRTPRGKGRAGGALSEVRPVELVGGLLGALRERGLAAELVEDVVLGCVTQSGEQGANLAKIAALWSGWPDHVSGATINRFCASGLDAVQLAAAKVAAGMEQVVVAGGVESMSRVPIFSDKGAWFADREVARKTGFVQMGFAADLVATLHGLERSELDAYAARSHQRAVRAREEDRFARSMIPWGDVLAADELVRDGMSAEKLAGFDPLFAHERSEALARARYPELGDLRHVHHRANSPSLADGAALLTIASRAGAEALGATPRAQILGWANASVEPVQMLTASTRAAHKALERAGVTLADIDLFEVNEAFAAVAVATQRALEIDPERYNVNGGAIAAGHAMGATGAILAMTCLDELERQDKELGLVAIAGGAGLGSAMVIRRG